MDEGARFNGQLHMEEDRSRPRPAAETHNREAVILT